MEDAGDVRLAGGYTVINPTFQTVTSIDGRIVPLGEAKVSAFDNAVLYGEGLFETFLGIDDRPIFLKEHLQRLHAGAKVLGIKLPVSDKQLTDWMIAVLRTHPDHVKQLRLTVTAGESPRYTGRQGPPRIILGAAPHRIPTDPYKLHLSEYRVDQDSEFRRIKTISYAIHAAALKIAKKHKCDDALLLNEKEKVAEASSANIFWVNRKVVFTPPLSAGCLVGITRARVMNEATRLGMSVKERDCSLSELSRADEVFISSSLKLVIGVSAIRSSKATFAYSAGPITAQLRSLFLRLAEV